MCSLSLSLSLLLLLFIVQWLFYMHIHKITYTLLKNNTHTLESAFIRQNCCQSMKCAENAKNRRRKRKKNLTNTHAHTHFSLNIHIFDDLNKTLFWPTYIYYLIHLQNIIYALDGFIYHVPIAINSYSKNQKQQKWIEKKTLWICGEREKWTKRIWMRDEVWIGSFS